MNTNAKGLLEEPKKPKQTKETKQDKVKPTKAQKIQAKLLNSEYEQCNICGLALQSMRSMRKHKRQDHIDAQPPGGTKQYHTKNLESSESTTLPPSKLRAVQKEVNSVT